MCIERNQLYIHLFDTIYLKIYNKAGKINQN